MLRMNFHGRLFSGSRSICAHFVRNASKNNLPSKRLVKLGMNFHGRLFSGSRSICAHFVRNASKNNLPSKRLVKWAEECAEAEGCRREALRAVRAPIYRLPYDSLPARTLISLNECGGFGRMRMERDERIYGYGTDDTQ